MGVFWTAAALLADANMAARARVLAALGVTKGAHFVIWSPLHAVRHVCLEVAQGSSACSDAIYALHMHDTTILMRVPTGGRKTCATLLNSELERILTFGKKWLLEFEAKKTKAIRISKQEKGSMQTIILDGSVIAEMRPWKSYIYGSLQTTKERGWHMLTE